MEHEKPTAGKFSLNYGVLLGLLMVCISVVTYVTGMALEGAQWPNIIYYIAFPIVVIYAISQYKKANANTLSLGDAIKVGLVVAIISALVFVVYGLLFNYVIDPEFTQQAIEVAKEKMLENPNMSPEQVEQSMVWVEKFSNPAIGMTFWVAMSAFFGLIYSLVGGLVMKNN